MARPPRRQATDRNDRIDRNDHTDHTDHTGDTMSRRQRTVTGAIVLAGIALCTACGTEAPPGVFAGSGSTPPAATGGVEVVVAPTGPVASQAANAGSKAATAAPSAPRGGVTTVVPATHGGSGGTTKACSVITAQDLRALGKVLSRQATEDAKIGESQCTYVGTAFLYTITIVDPGSGKLYLDAAKARVPAALAAQVVDLAGIGDGALGVFSSRYCGLLFYKGATTVTTALVTRPSVSGKTTVIGLARTAAARL